MSRVEIQQYLSLAGEDLQTAHDNLQMDHLRTAASRAYYAMFYAATAILGSHGIWRSKHRGIIAAFGEHFVKSGLIEPKYGRMLNDAFHARLDSDYAPHPNPNVETVLQSVENAQVFVERITRYLEDISVDTEDNYAPQ
jgi:uncharacterized protein (UPF0332 family)